MADGCETVVAQFDYKASNEDELSFRRGECISIISKEPEESGDVGWWIGKINHRKGVFPLNYVNSSSSSSSCSTKTASSPLSKSQTLVPVSHLQDSPLLEIPYENLEFEKICGAGGFGQVYKGQFNGLNVAIKKLTVSSLKEDDIKIKAEELKAEGELILLCSHPNICRLYGACTFYPNFCLVMEFAAGGALSTVLREYSLSPKVIIDWATQIASGMQYLHCEAPVCVVHRDLKSSNILLSLQGEKGALVERNVLKITDFGLARKFSQTEIMTTAGTYAWMAPEVIRHSTFSKAADIWSYGVLLWELFTSEVPYHGIHMMTVAYNVAIKGSTLPLPSSCPAPFNSLMSSCWLLDPHARPTFKDILDQLHTATDPFSMTPSEAFSLQQLLWKEEISVQFQVLVKPDQEIQRQQDELQKLQKERIAHEKNLSERERQLAEKERELQERELRLLLSNPPLMPTPVKRTRRPYLPSKLKKSDIGSPSDFIHVHHYGPTMPKQIPLEPSPLTEALSSPSSPVGDQFPITKDNWCRLSVVDPPSDATITPLFDPARRASLDSSSSRSTVRPVSTASDETNQDISPHLSRPSSRLLSPRTASLPSPQALEDEEIAPGCFRGRSPLPFFQRLFNSDLRGRTVSDSCMTSEQFQDRNQKARRSKTVHSISRPYNVHHITHYSSSQELEAGFHDVWYHPTMRHDEAVNHLLGKRVGSFVVRKSYSTPRNYALVVLQQSDLIWNGTIVHSQQGFQLGSESRMRFQSLNELVRHFSTIPYNVDDAGRPHMLRFSDKSRPRSQSETQLFKTELV